MTDEHVIIDSGVGYQGERVVGELVQRVGAGEVAGAAPPAEVEGEHAAVGEVVGDEVSGAGGTAPVVEEDQSGTRPGTVVISGQDGLIDRGHVRSSHGDVRERFRPESIASRDGCRRIDPNGPRLVKTGHVPVIRQMSYQPVDGVVRAVEVMTFGRLRTLNDAEHSVPISTS